MKIIRKSALAVAMVLGSAAVHAQYANIAVDSSFSATNHQSLSASLLNLYTNNFGFYLPNGRAIFPYNEVIATVSTIIPGINQPNVLAYTYLTPYKGPIWVNSIAFTGYGGGTQSVLMEGVLHEGDHHIYGAHTCGGSADQDDNGPFGVTSYYMVKLIRQSTNLDASQRNQAASNALSRAQYNICAAAAKTRIQNAYFYGQFPQNCYYDESGQQICATDPGTPPVLPPPPPSQCYYDESGQHCYS